MSEPVILINGRRLVDAQVQALRAAISSFVGALPSSATMDYHDRLAEVQEMFRRDATGESRKALSPGALRSDRILQLAGIVPERATDEERQIAEDHATKGTPVDIAAAYLFRRPAC